LMPDQVAADILGLTAQIVSAHASKNWIEADALPSVDPVGLPIAVDGR
jgi:predicted transcriptional regulator